MWCNWLGRVDVFGVIGLGILAWLGQSAAGLGPSRMERVSGRGFTEKKRRGGRKRWGGGIQLAGFAGLGGLAGDRGGAWYACGGRWGRGYGLIAKGAGGAFGCGAGH